MVSIIRDKQADLVSLCRKYHVRRLDVFGSAATETMHAESDLDFLVEFDESLVRQRFDTYFEFLNALELLFGRPVDLVEPGGLANPYFIETVNQTRRPLYAAS